jgi:transposase
MNANGGCSCGPASSRASGGAASRTGLCWRAKRPGVNLMVLWEEYRDVHRDGYGYSRFCDLFREFERRLSPVMRQHHVAGDKAFVDYSGKKVTIVDPATSEIRVAEIFVAVLGASNFTYAEATWTQSLPDWISAHIRMFRFLVAFPGSSFQTISRAAFTRPRSMTPRSTAATVRWLPITVSACSRHGRESQGIRPRSRPG